MNRLLLHPAPAPPKFSCLPTYSGTGHSRASIAMRISITSPTSIAHSLQTSPAAFRNSIVFRINRRELAEHIR